MHDIFAILCTRLMRTDIIAISLLQCLHWLYMCNNFAHNLVRSVHQTYIRPLQEVFSAYCYPRPFCVHGDCPWITYTSIQPQPATFTYIDIYKICVDTCIMHKVHGTIPSKQKDTCTQRAIIIHCGVTALPPCAQAGSRAHSHISPFCTANVWWQHEFQTIHLLTFTNRGNVL